MSVDGSFPVAVTVVRRGRMGKSPSESIVTEVPSDGLALGYYVWGPPTKLSWYNSQLPTPSWQEKSPMVLRFKSGTIAIEATFSAPGTITLKSTHPKRIEVHVD
jgi:hypothetical protein